MFIIPNSLIPFRGFLAITIWPFIFVRREFFSRFGAVDFNHESIHGRQQVEVLVVAIILAVILALVGCRWWSLLVLPLYFYWYGLEYLVRLCILRNQKRAYRAISFEQEAYAHEREVDYLQHRLLFAWLRYLR